MPTILSTIPSSSPAEVRREESMYPTFEVGVWWPEEETFCVIAEFSSLWQSPDDAEKQAHEFCARVNGRSA